MLKLKKEMENLLKILKLKQVTNNVAELLQSIKFNFLCGTVWMIAG
jgi:hypothetical protein